MHQLRNRTLTTAVGAGAVMASVGGTSLALVAGMGGTAVALPAPGQDINNDWGQTPEEVTAEIRAQVAADPAVVDAKARYAKALRVVDARKADVSAALRAYHKALRTKSHLDDRRTKRALTDARRALTKALDAAAVAKTALDQARAVATEQITAQHYVLAPTPTDTVTPPPVTDTVTPPPVTDTATAPPPTTTSAPPPPPPTSSSPALVNGTFLGLKNNTNPYGATQVQITVVDSVVTVVTTPVYATTSDSASINKRAVPILQNEAVAAQSSKIASVSGATYTSAAFKESLHSALLLAGLPD
jgi:uncharacterized protein with FMN-binding domain